jgi:hypothetical protein
MKRLRHRTAHACAADLNASWPGSSRCRHRRIFGACPGPSQTVIRARSDDPAASSKRTGWRWRTVPWLSGHHESSVRQVLRFARDDLREWSEEGRP